MNAIILDTLEFANKLKAGDSLLNKLKPKHERLQKSSKSN
jgi:hypothetical protein